MSTTDTGTRYHRECTGNALETTHKHAEGSKGDIQFFAACFCPFVQRVWIALEYLEIPYTVRGFSRISVMTTALTDCVSVSCAQ